jgi:hypothetical protein
MAFSLTLTLTRREERSSRSTLPCQSHRIVDLIDQSIVHWTQLERFLPCLVKKNITLDSINQKNDDSAHAHSRKYIQPREHTVCVMVLSSKKRSRSTCRSSVLLCLIPLLLPYHLVCQLHKIGILFSIRRFLQERHRVLNAPPSSTRASHRRTQTRVSCMSTPEWRHWSRTRCGRGWCRRPNRA